ncbi:hypothetical protein GLYMA_05G102700v4 [Glycine max]|nr:hypothetical protein GLYMA_05G102700v4 [Glycine max]KAH1133703.1 hypothetical protein GYH30_012216 [Glycine max]
MRGRSGRVYERDRVKLGILDVVISIVKGPSKILFVHRDLCNSCTIVDHSHPSRGQLEREESCEASDDEKRSVVTAMDCIFSVLTHYGEATGRLVCRKRSSIPDVGLLSTSLIISLGRIKQSFVLTNPHLPDMPTVYASDTLLNLTGFKVVTLYKLDQVQMNLLIFSHSS